MSTNIFCFLSFQKFPSGAATDKLIISCSFLRTVSEPSTRAGSNFCGTIEVKNGPGMRRTETFIRHRDSERMNVIYLETSNPSEWPRCQKYTAGVTQPRQPSGHIVGTHHHQRL